MLIQTNKGLCVAGDIYKGHICPDYPRYAELNKHFSKPIIWHKQNRDKFKEFKKLTANILLWESIDK